MISQHLPILQVIVALLTAPLCLLVRDQRFAWGVSLAASWTAFLIAALLLHQTLEQGVISYKPGGWSVPWGIEYRIDTVNAFVLLIVTAISSAVLLFAQRSVAREILSTRIPLFYTAYMLCLAGLLGITVTGDVFNLFVFMEISALSSYTLIALSEQRRALTAAYQYLFMGTIGATFILIGIGLLYMMTGTLNMQDLSQRLPAVTGTRTVETAFAFLTVGISIKLALVPLHLWLPNAYAYAPSVVSAFIAATATKVAFYVLLRFMFTIFGASFAFKNMPLSFIFMALALAAIFAGSTAAIFQDNIKRLLAYSSIAQIGYMILGISLASATGLTAAILHLFNHALMKGALFLALGCVVYRLGMANMEQMRGLGRRMPWTMAAFVIGALSLVGVPLTVGFISKWYLVVGALERGWWPLAVAVLAASLLTLVYVWRVEVLTLSTYPLVTHSGTDQARRSGRLYLGLLPAPSVGFLLFAVIWTWQLAGTLDFVEGGSLRGTASPALLGILFALYAFGISKAALMPLHRWLPAAMVAPTPVSALLHAVAVVKGGVFFLLKVTLYVFGIDLVAELQATQWLLYVAAATILLASLVALRHDNLKARLAYSTISQLGYVVLGTFLATSSGIIGATLHMIMHAFGKITLFFCAGAILVATQKTAVSQMHGLGRNMPFTMSAFLIGSLSIIGLPPAGGVWSKWFLMLGTLEAGQQALLAVLMVGSLLSALYLLSSPASSCRSVFSAIT